MFFIRELISTQGYHSTPLRLLKIILHVLLFSGVLKPL